MPWCGCMCGRGELLSLFIRWQRTSIAVCVGGGRALPWLCGGGAWGTPMSILGYGLADTVL